MKHFHTLESVTQSLRKRLVNLCFRKKDFQNSSGLIPSHVNTVASLTLILRISRHGHLLQHLRCTKDGFEQKIDEQFTCLPRHLLIPKQIPRLHPQLIPLNLSKRMPFLCCETKDRNVPY